MTIVVGFDDSPHGRAAVSEGERLALQRDRHLLIVRYIAHSAGDSFTRVKAERAEVEHIESEIEGLRARLTDRGLTATVRIVHGLAHGEARALLDVCEAVDAELLIIGLRRRSRVGKMLMGSVALEVLVHADMPVLTVKSPPRRRR